MDATFSSNGTRIRYRGGVGCAEICLALCYSAQAILKIIWTTALLQRCQHQPFFQCCVTLPLSLEPYGRSSGIPHIEEVPPLLDIQAHNCSHLAIYVKPHCTASIRGGFGCLLISNARFRNYLPLVEFLA